MPRKPKQTRMRRWRQFSLRALLALMLLCALLAALVSRYLLPYRAEQAVIAAVKDAGGSVTIEWQGPSWLKSYAEDLPAFRRVVTVQLRPAPPQGPVALPSGTNPYRATQFGRDQMKFDFALLSRLASLRKLDMGPAATDDDLRHLSHLTELEDLDVTGAEVTERGLAHLKRLENLQRLVLRDTPIEAEGLSALALFPQLSELSLRDVLVQPAAIKQLVAAAPSLQVLELDATHLEPDDLLPLRSLKQLRVLNVYEVPTKGKWLQQTTQRWAQQLPQVKTLQLKPDVANPALVRGQQVAP